MARRDSGVSIDDVKEEVAFALLKAALEDGSTGGKLHGSRFRWHNKHRGDPRRRHETGGRLQGLPGWRLQERDGKEKMIQLTESIVLTRVGRVRVSKAIWAHLPEKLRKTSRYVTIEELANSAKEFPDSITDDASGKCFVGGIEGGHPILYSFGYRYDKVLRSGRGFQRKIETFAIMGSGMVYARRAYVKGMARRGSGVSIDDVKEEVAFALLKAALEDALATSYPSMLTVHFHFPLDARVKGIASRALIASAPRSCNIVPSVAVEIKV
ncbi:hypothetical protein D8674_034362 [Pyrus ussuriensis x Pyrus communis]|uniref:Uncharacterized protein n=1 Tax=Pyrus ussuriensis x Pyrus communis TaxID=2448454 RepID=A0A5N5HRW5_9ROSA|nr:hypothetical protein D8674_034362 [Pyrus ussuriensis x Pyrus communis]